MILAETIPNWLQNLGNEVGNLWPLVVMFIAIMGAGWRGVGLLRKTINDAVLPIKDEFYAYGEKTYAKVDNRLGEIESQIYPNGGSSLSDKLDRIGTEIGLISNSQAQVNATVQVFFEASPQAMYRSDENGITIQCNQAYLDFWGFNSISEARSNDWLENVVDRRLAEERLASIIRTPSEFKYSSRLLDGRTMQVTGQPIYNSGMFVGYVGYVFDASSPPPHHPVQEPTDEQLNIR